jgi:cyanophycinase-like exopeptidase
MSPLPRVLTVMGSGETAPTMAKVHRALLKRLGTRPVPGVLLDTPFGFQENADDITSRAQAYFAESVGTPIGVASLRSAASSSPAELAAFVAAVQGARYVFAGPGSPSYTLRQWRGGPLPGLLTDKLRNGGVVTFSSAAALTLGVATIPVYEVYKAGEPPSWLQGLDILGEAGLRAAVIPHYNNTEGGNHDTRYCYLGERRLSVMEAELPKGAFILGIDEHTGLILDLGAGEATVVGLGSVTVRARGRSVCLEVGTTLSVAELGRLGEGLARAPRAGAVGAKGGEEAPCTTAPVLPRPGAQLTAAVQRRHAAFTQALAARDVDAAVHTIVELDEDLLVWSRDSLAPEEAVRARSTLHAMVLSLGQLAKIGARDPREFLGPFVEVLLEQRAAARAAGRFAEADTVRERLGTLGVEVRDTPTGSMWVLADPAAEALLPPGRESGEVFSPRDVNALSRELRQ